jgi:hypothetical protein
MSSYGPYIPQGGARVPKLAPLPDVWSGCLGVETGAEVAHALKLALRTDTERTAFVNIYKGTQSGQRLRRGLACILTDDPGTLAFFDGLIMSGDGI